MKLLIADTAYPEFLKTVPIGSGSYDKELAAFLSHKFGTFDAYSQNLNKLGHECIDVIANHGALQSLWAKQHGTIEGGSVLDAQIYHHNPDVLFLQDLSLKPRFVTRPPVIAAQCSCAFDDASAKQCDVIFTSLPTHISRIEALGVKAVYLPLAFEPSVVDRCFPDVFPVTPTETIEMDFGRIHDVVFIGGVGNPSHWKRGMETLEAVAREIPTFEWWGYGVETLPASSPLLHRYQGEAYGLKMYEILLQSKICLNRHGEVAQGFSNNLRMFEATGCGALLLTEVASNLDELFNRDDLSTYVSPEDAVQKIEARLSHPEILSHIAQNGQATTLRCHTYAQRMKVVSDTLTEMLCPA